MYNFYAVAVLFYMTFVLPIHGRVEKRRKWKSEGEKGRIILDGEICSWKIE
jgi:hypothetical protein